MPEVFNTGPGPSRRAFFLAYGFVVLAGFVGAIIGAGWAELGCRGDCTGSIALGAMIGGAGTALGTGVIAVLVLRAMAEWRRPG